MKMLRVLLIGLLALLSPLAEAGLTLSSVFGNHMVLQQGMPIRIWGWADAGEKVRVQLGNAEAEAVAGVDGAWRVELPAMKADGKARSLKVASGVASITLTDVLLGEVWICSGQSNMEWPVRRSLNAKEEIAAADHPEIRLFDVPGHVRMNTPQKDARGQWRICQPGTVANFSAVGYFFGRALARELAVPVGLVGSNWGGTRIEPWTPLEGFNQVAELEAYVNSLKPLDPASPEGKALRRRYLKQVASWLGTARRLTAEGKHIGNAPTMALPSPKGGATQIYNGMAAGLTPLSVRGAIWYQGESNAGDGLAYEYMKEALVKGWRGEFENDDLSFYWVQLANFRRRNKLGWGPVREAQRRALRLPHTGMAVTIDIGTTKNIHPPNKQDVGGRLALWALAKDYGRDIVYSGPLYKSHSIEGGKIRVRFDHVDGGLMVGKKEGLKPAAEIPDGELQEFEIRDRQGNWHEAKAEIDGDSVWVWNEKVENPDALRYAYQSDPENPNLYNRAGLPASPFTSAD